MPHLPTINRIEFGPDLKGSLEVTGGGDDGDQLRTVVWIDYNFHSNKLDILSGEYWASKQRETAEYKLKIYSLKESNLKDYTVYVTKSKLKDQDNFSGLPLKPEINRMCLSDSIRYLAGSGIKLRQSDSAGSNTMATLTYNSQACKIEDKGDWTKIYSHVADAEGWILKEYLASQKDSDRSLLREKAKDSFSANDFENAVKYMERYLDTCHEDIFYHDYDEPYYTEDLKSMQAYYQAAKMTDKAERIERLINAPKKVQKSSDDED